MGARWRVVPAEYGPWRRAVQLFIRWSKLGAWQGVLVLSGPVRVGLLGGGADRHRVGQGLAAGEDADTGGAGRRDVGPAGAVPGEAAPVGRPAEAPLDRPAPGEHDEALGLRVAGDDAVARAVEVRPLAAAPGRGRAVVDALAQGGPAGLAGVQRLERVPVLHGSRHRRDREPGAL